MKKILLLILTSTLLSSCSSYEFKSAQNQDHTDYSTWYRQPKNS